MTINLLNHGCDYAFTTAKKLHCECCYSCCDTSLGFRLIPVALSPCGGWSLEHGPSGSGGHDSSALAGVGSFGFEIYATGSGGGGGALKIWRM